MSGQVYAPAVLPRANNADIHWIVCWEGPRAGLDVVKNRTFCGCTVNRTISSSSNLWLRQYQDCANWPHTCNSDTRNSVHGSEVLRNFNTLGGETRRARIMLSKPRKHFSHLKFSSFPRCAFPLCDCCHRNLAYSSDIQIYTKALCGTNWM
jgi:hypothetical protein